METLELRRRQQAAYDLVVNQHRSVIINGKAGTGKTTLTHAIYQGLKAQGFGTLSVAFTGKAASLMPNGTTASRAAAMRRGEEDVLPGNYSDAVPWNNVVRSNVNKVFGNADKAWGHERLVVFIDEAGQLSSQKARLFYDIGMKYRANLKLTTKPIFVISADFGQLNCINGNLIFEPAVYEYWKTSKTKDQIVLPSIIDEIGAELVVLDEVVRQDDPRYIRALDWMYFGKGLHPLFRERLRAQVPSSVSTVYFNNVEVVKENANFIKRFIQDNPNAKYRDYQALGDQLSDSDLKQLAPVTPTLRVYEGMPFTITVNVPDPIDPKELLVANGQTVTVKSLGRKGFSAIKSDGTEVDLGMVAHWLPANSTGKMTEFIQLPGYAGSAVSLYKSQGSTFDFPMSFAAWQWHRSGKRISLKNQPGSTYVMCSRNTRIEDLYFDTSFGISEAEQLLYQAATGVNEKVLDYLLQGRPPLWASDAMNAWVTVELEQASLVEIEGHRCIRTHFVTTYLQSGQETHYNLLYYWSGGELLLVTGESQTGDISQAIDNLEFHVLYQELTKTWLEHYSELASVQTPAEVSLAA